MTDSLLAMASWSAFVWVQIDGLSLVHVNPRSMRQSVQPSSSSSFSSSHYSLEARRPSPQVEVQFEGVPEHLKPKSMIPFEQPSESFRFLSSQDSMIVMIPSP